MTAETYKMSSQPSSNLKEKHFKQREQQCKGSEAYGSPACLRSWKEVWPGCSG